VTAIHLGRGSPTRLGATYPPAPRNHVNAGLLGVAARRDCPFHPDWTGSSLLLWSSPHGGEVLPPTLSYAVRTFLQCLVSQLAPAAVWRASRGWLSCLPRGGPRQSATQAVGAQAVGAPPSVRCGSWSSANRREGAATTKKPGRRDAPA